MTLNTPLKLTSQNASAGIAVAMPLPALGVGTIDAYLAHINRLPMLTAAQEFTLAQEYRRTENLDSARPASECRKGNDACVELLYLMRQVRLALGKQKNRVQLIWVVSDRLPVDPEINRAYDEETAGFLIIPAPDSKNNDAWLAWLNQQNLGGGIQLIDPSGEKMMVFPDKAESNDFVRMRKDLERLLKLNRKGEKI